MSLQTYTVTSASFEAEAGSNISGGANPTVTLVISPAEGYTVTHSNFSIGNALPSQVQSATFSQAGANVNCVVTFANGFTMPAADVELLIDIDGTANLIGYTINGNYIISETNTTSSSGTTAFSATGVEGQEVTLFTKTFTSDSNHFFFTAPYYYQDPTARPESDYIVTWTDNAVGASFTSRTYTVKYIIGNQSETLNNIYFVANAEPSTPAAGTAILTGYTVITSAWSSSGGSRNLTMFGDAGASFTLNTSINGVNVNESITLDSNGFFVKALSAGANSSGSTKTYTYTFSGNIKSPFPQTNPIVISQPSS